MAPGRRSPTTPTRRVGWLLCAITAVYAIDAALTEICRVFFVPLALSVVQSFAASTAFAALLIGLLLTPFTPQAARRAAEAAATDAAGAAASRGTLRAGSSCRCG